MNGAKLTIISLIAGCSEMERKKEVKRRWKGGGKEGGRRGEGVKEHEERENNKKASD